MIIVTVLLLLLFFQLCNFSPVNDTEFNGEGQIQNFEFVKINYIN